MGFFYICLNLLALLLFSSHVYATNLECWNSSNPNKAVIIREEKNADKNFLQSQIRILAEAQTKVDSAEGILKEQLYNQFISAAVSFFRENTTHFKSFSAMIGQIKKIASETTKSKNSRPSQKIPKAANLITTDFIITSSEGPLWTSNDKKWSIHIAYNVSKNKILKKGESLLDIVYNKTNSYFTTDYDFSLENIKEWNSGLLIKLSNEKSIFVYESSDLIKIQEMDYVFHVGKETIFFAENSTNSLGKEIQALNVKPDKIEIVNLFEATTYPINQIIQLTNKHFLLGKNTRERAFELIFEENSQPVLRESKFLETDYKNINMRGLVYYDAPFKAHLEIVHSVNGEQIKENVSLPISIRFKKDYWDGTNTFYSIDANNFIVSILRLPFSRRANSLWFQRNAKGKFVLKESLDYMQIFKHSPKQKLLAADVEGEVFWMDLNNPKEKVYFPLPGELQIHESYVIHFVREKYELFQINEELKLEPLVSLKPSIPIIGATISSHIVADQHLFVQYGPSLVFYTNLKDPQKLSRHFNLLSSFQVVKSDTLDLVVGMDKARKNIYLLNLNSEHAPSLDNKISSENNMDPKLFSELSIEHKDNKIFFGNLLSLEILNTNEWFGGDK
ncbi:MAG: hypothetical protein VX642_11370 [Bdellovibrionota bacterium]|nr:hypothetical protein [Bdellovibrionota bacterium]